MAETIAKRMNDELEMIMSLGEGFLSKQSQDYREGFKRGLIFMRNLDNQMQHNDVAQMDEFISGAQKAATQHLRPGETF